MKKYILIILTATALSCNSKNKPKEEIQAPITKPVEHVTATPDQAERRRQSEEYCKAHNVPIYTNPNTLFTEPEEKVTLRSKDEIVDRAIALCYMELKSEKADTAMLGHFDRRYNAMAKLSAKEKKFILSEHPSEQEMTDANWRAEGVHIMLWALGYIDSLVYPATACDVARDFKHIFNRTEKQFREDAKLRSKKEILSQADLVLRLHWACVEARVSKEPAPGNLNTSVVLERHYALNWLIRYMNQEWDDVGTDT